ncbi:MAG: sugar phosphate nucleotidyltransferase [Candidatus Gastranaerophilaceae bacterium]
MKGVILAGGSGTRLFPNTKVTNKHLLPVYNQPMIYYPIQTLMRAGITDILIMPGKDNAGDFAKLLGSGKEFNANFQFKVQDHAGGLSYAVALAEDFVGDDNFVVIFGDNIIEDTIIEDVQNFEDGAKVFLKRVPDPERFGIAELNGSTVVNIEEKPKEPKTDWCVIGMYIYDSKAFDYIRTLKPSARGELEITDLNNIYIKQGKMKAGYIKGYWFDTGTHESMVDAAYKIKNHDKPMEPLSLEQKESPKVVIGSILYDTKKWGYGTSKYLKDYIPTVLSQSYKNIELVFVDNSEEENNANIEFVQKNYPKIKIIRPGKNTGFAGGNNIMIDYAKEVKADYYIACNNDMMLEPNVVSELVNSVMKTPQFASATCKVKRWDFSNKGNDNKGKTNFLDTAGIAITKEHRFIDRGQGEIDHGQYDQAEEIFGASGAVVIYRMSSLEDVAFKNEDGRYEYFDELMFMYKEDVDLAYRLQWAGYKCLYNPSAIVYHDRSIEAKGKGIIGIIKGRLGRNRRYKEWSWLNHHIILNKMLDSNLSFSTRLKTWFFELKSNAYVLVFEPFLVKQWYSLFKMRKQIMARRDQVKRRIKTKAHIEKLMID